MEVVPDRYGTAFGNLNPEPTPNACALPYSEPREQLPKKEKAHRATEVREPVEAVREVEPS
jgi:hypothetical protein